MTHFYSYRFTIFRSQWLSGMLLFLMFFTSPQAEPITNDFNDCLADMRISAGFGQTQFLPTSFERLAVDYSGDGRRDIIGNISDALASAANYLRQTGQKAGQPWGVEVSVPVSLSSRTKNRRDRKPLSFRIDQGLTRIDDSPLPAPPLTNATKVVLLIAVRSSDTAFLVTPTFEALMRYNPSEYYALTIGLLANRLRRQ